MATYYDIFGQKVQYLSADPSPVAEGQVWYNSTSNTAKVRTYNAAGTWASSPSLNLGKQSGGAAGTTLAALAFGSSQAPNSRSSETWNGSSWTVTNSMSQDGDYCSGFGTATAAVAGGDGGPVGANSNSLYNGTSWTAGNPTTQYAYASCGLGTQTAGMLAGAYDGAAHGTANYVQLWNGTCWSNSPYDLNTARYNPLGTAGTQTAAIVFGGNPSNKTAVEEYNGGAWTSVNGLSTGSAAGSGGGTQASALAFGGGGGPKAVTQLWDGTCWSANPNAMPTAKEEMNNIMGTETANMSIGGIGGPGNSTVFEYTGPGVSTQTITVT